MAEIDVLYGCGIVLIVVLSFARRWPPARTLGHALLLAVLLTPNPRPEYALWPLILLPLAWNGGTWTLALTILPLYLVPRFAPAALPDYLLLIIWLPPIVLTLRQLLRDCLPVRAPSSLVGVPPANF